MARPPRIDGFDYRGPHRYFLTFCVLGRRLAFLDHAAARMIVTNFLQTSADCHFAVLAYCVMPDHVHLLVEETSEASDLRRYAKRMKQGSGQAYAHRFGHALWQPGYFEHVLRQDEDAVQTARYILDNPVRAGLARHPLEYPFVGSGIWKMHDLLAGWR
jgi:putative transposase